MNEATRAHFESVILSKREEYSLLIRGARRLSRDAPEGDHAVAYLLAFEAKDEYMRLERLVDAETGGSPLGRPDIP